MDEYSYLADVLIRNKEKNFVDRIINNTKYPSLDLGEGKSATHLMSWGTADGRAIVYPTVLYDGKKLKQYDQKEAFGKAMDSGEFIEFKSEQEADWFSKNYKMFWGNQEE